MLSRKRLSRLKRKADDVKQASTSGNTCNANDTVKQKAYPKYRQGLESNALRVDDQSQSRKGTNIYFPIHHS